MEPVSDRVKPITLKVAIYEGEEPVTNIETVTFDAASGNMDERKKWVNLMLQERQYKRRLLTASCCGTPKPASNSRAWKWSSTGRSPMTSERNNHLIPGLDDLLNRHFAGKVVRKDLTKLVKEGANVPVYVLEYLLGSYCASNDEAVIQDGLQTVKKVLAENYVRPDEAEKVKSLIRERGSLKVIDKVTVTLNEKRDVYEALLGNLGVKGVEVNSSYVKKFEKLLVGGIWSIITLEYFFEEDQKGSPFVVRDLKPIQMPNMDMDELFQGRRGFTEEQWIDVLLPRPAWSQRISPSGMMPTGFSVQRGWLESGDPYFFARRGYAHAVVNVRGTGKSTGLFQAMGPVEAQDVANAVEWLAARPWCTGRAGLFGISYFAWLHIQAAMLAPPSLAAIFAPFGATDFYRDFLYHGGIFSWRFLAHWKDKLDGLRYESWYRTRHGDHAYAEAIRAAMADEEIAAVPPIVACLANPHGAQRVRDRHRAGPH